MCTFGLRKLKKEEEKEALIKWRVLEKYMFVSHTKHMQRKNNRSTSFTIDNMY